MLLGGEEIVAEVEDGRGPRRFEAHPVVAGDVGEAAGDVRAAGEQDDARLCARIAAKAAPGSSPQSSIAE